MVKYKGLQEFQLNAIGANPGITTRELKAMQAAAGWCTTTSRLNYLVALGKLHRVRKGKEFRYYAKFHKAVQQELPLTPPPVQGLPKVHAEAANGPRLVLEIGGVRVPMDVSQLQELRSLLGAVPAVQ